MLLIFSHTLLLRVPETPNKGSIPFYIRKFLTPDLTELLLQARSAVAPLLGADAEEVVFVPNALSGINTVLRNLEYVEGDLILHFSTIYGGCLKTIRSLEETTPVRGYSIDLTYPIEDDHIIRKVTPRSSQYGNRGGELC